MVRKCSRFWIIAALALCTSLTSTSWGRANEKATEFNIPPQSLDSALLVFAEQADVQVSVSTVAIAGMKTQGVVGRLIPSGALTRLLEATGLAFSTIGERTFSVALPSTVKQATKMLNRPDAPVDGDGVLLLAQAPAGTNASVGPGSISQRSADESEGLARRGMIDEVVVTGTRIRGAEPVGADLIQIDREEIERTGAFTVAQVMQTLPQNFGGGPAEANSATRAGERTNTSSGAGINLRALGAGATLVLVNGRRLAPAGIEANFVDVSSIPLSAVERIDVLLDGASAIYGSDAIGGVVNVILRRDYKGAETSASFGRSGEGDADSLRLGQTLGMEWASGSAMISYEYFGRDPLTARDRSATANADLRSFGGSDFRSPQGTPGTIVVSGRTWAIPAGQDGSNLTAQMLTEGTSNPFNGNQSINILGEQERNSAFAAVRQSIGDALTLFVDGLYTRRDTFNVGAGSAANLRVTNANPFYVNPTGATTPVTVRYNFLRDLGPITLDAAIETANLAAGADFALGETWSLTAQLGYAKETIDQIQNNFPIGARLQAALLDPDPATAFNPFGDGSFTNPATLASIRGGTAFSSESEIRSAGVTATGPILQLPAGALQLALGGEYREQDFDIVNRATPGDATTTIRKATRDNRAAFLEFRVPIVSAKNARPGLAEMTLSVAGRYERYSDFGDAISPVAGLTWAPADGFALKARWSESFKAPNLPTLDETANFTFISPLPDSQSPSGFSNVLLWGGQNADLQEETATSRSVGIELRPSAISGLNLGLTYFRIDYDDRIAEPAAPTSLDDPLTAVYVTRNPTPEQRARACNNSVYFGVDPAECLNAPIDGLGDFRTQNIARSRVSGIDFLASQTFRPALGDFNIEVSATYLLDVKSAAAELSPFQDMLDTPRNPVNLRARATTSWKRGPLGIAAIVSYTADYLDNVSVPNRKIDSWVTADLNARYELPSHGQWLDGASVALNVQNLFDEAPPFYNNSGGVGYDPTNADVMGRTVSVQFRLAW